MAVVANNDREDQNEQRRSLLEYLVVPFYTTEKVSRENRVVVETCKFIHVPLDLERAVSISLQPVPCILQENAHLI
jgi:hypothetical protein